MRGGIVYKPKAFWYAEWERQKDREYRERSTKKYPSRLLSFIEKHEQQVNIGRVSLELGCVLHPFSRVLDSSKPMRIWVDISGKVHELRGLDSGLITLECNLS
jgi:hypothetical protein